MADATRSDTALSASPASRGAADAKDAPAGPERPRDLPRVILAGVSFAAITEPRCIGVILDELDRGRGGWVVTANIDILRQIRKDEAVRELVGAADLFVADGMPLLWAARLQGTPLPQRVCGSNLIETLSAAAARRGRSVFLLGGDEGAAEQAAAVLLRRHPDLRIAGAYCPPFGFEDDAEQMRRLSDAVRSAEPDLVYVALGFPKQERLIRKLRADLSDRLSRTWWLGVGISFSFLSGRVRRAPRWMQRAGLEWLHRLSQEPRRLIRRYVIDDIPFAIALLGAALGRRWGRRRPGGGADAR